MKKMVVMGWVVSLLIATCSYGFVNVGLADNKWLKHRLRSPSAITEPDAVLTTDQLVHECEKGTRVCRAFVEGALYGLNAGTFFQKMAAKENKSIRLNKAAMNPSNGEAQAIGVLMTIWYHNILDDKRLRMALKDRPAIWAMVIFLAKVHWMKGQVNLAPPQVKAQ